MNDSTTKIFWRVAHWPFLGLPALFGCGGNGAGTSPAGADGSASGSASGTASGSFAGVVDDAGGSMGSGAPSVGSSGNVAASGSAIGSGGSGSGSGGSGAGSGSAIGSGSGSSGVDSGASTGSSSGASSGSTTTCASGDGGSGPLPWPAANTILCQIVPPTFPSKTCTVTDAAYGAKGDGVADNTDAFKKAITACSQAGGGRVVVPSGTYVSGAIELLDNVNLQFQTGAVVKFSGDVTKYPIVLTRYEGIELMNHSPMIYAYKRTNIGITGPGLLDASGTGSWNVGANRAPLEAYANSNTPVAQRNAAGCCRSTFVEPYSCTNVLIQGITLQGAHFWQIHPTLSTNVTVDGVHVTDSGLSNDDGFDPESSDHVLLTNSTIESSDDAMAVKSGRDADGRRINVPTSNFVFMHSAFASHVGLLTLGSEATGGIHDVYGYDIKTTTAGVTYLLQIKGNTQRGGVVTNVHLDTVASNNVRNRVINADMHYMGQTGSYPPSYGDFSLSNAVISGATQVLNLVGLSSANPLGPVVMSNSTYTGIGNATNTAQNATVTWTNVTINGVPAH